MSTTTSTHTTPRLSPNLRSIRFKSSPPDISGYLKTHAGPRKTSQSSVASDGPTPVDPFLRQYLKQPQYNLFKEKPDVLIIRPKKSIKPLTPRYQAKDVKIKEEEFKNKDYDNHYDLIKKSIPKTRLTSKLSKLLPSDFVDCELNDLIILVSRMLTNLIDLNDKLVPKISHEDKKKSVLTRYHSRTPPNISPLSYLARLSKFNNFSNATLLTTIYYIDLLSFNYQPFFTLNSWTVHRFLLVATMTCQKSMEDFFFTNDHYAKVGGVNLNELNCLELDFLTRIKWKCVPSKGNQPNTIKYSKNVLDLYYNQLVELMGKNSGVNEFIYSFNTEDSDMSDEIDNEQDLDYKNLPDKSKYNSKGFSYDGSSSPHLKRRFPV